jgi:hypothetical protein
MDLCPGAPDRTMSAELRPAEAGAAEPGHGAFMANQSD